VTKTFVVVGANLAGGRAVETLRTEGFDGRVVLVGAERDRPYERPPLSKDVLRGESDPVFLRDEEWYAANEIDLRLGVRVTDLDPAGTARLDTDETIAFDACLLATGGRPRRLHSGAVPDGVHYLRTLRDATALRGELAGKPRMVVVGAGFIGAEVAASARSVGCEVTMIEVLDVPLQRVLGTELGQLYARIHTDHGVDLRLGEGIEEITGGPRVESVIGTSGTVYRADIVVVGIGIEPNMELAVGAGIACDNGIVVDEYCRTSAPNVFAAGDVANRPDVFSGGRIRAEHFQNAQNQGPAAARNMLGKDEPFQEVPWFWSDQYDVNLQTLGHPSASHDRVQRGSLDNLDFITFDLEGDRIAAAVAINRGRDIAATRRLIQRRITVDRKRLGDDDVPLKELLKR
jgi:3-phenylpropionate/trans-cinnamate dioxygenase ferredoxin reductase subunit